MEKKKKKVIRVSLTFIAVSNNHKKKSCSDIQSAVE